MKFKSIFLLCVLYATPVKSQVLVDTISMNGLTLGPSLSFSKVEYEDENDNVFEVKRKTIGLGLTYNTGNVGLLFQAAHNMESEILESNLKKGKGYMLGAGANFLIYSQNKLSFIGYGLLNYVSDSYKKDKPKVEMDVTDIHLGMLLAVKANRLVTFYGGLDLVPYSDGDIKRAKSKVDIEREELLNLKLGLDFTFPSVNLRPEVTLIGEKTFTITSSFVI